MSRYSSTALGALTIYASCLIITPKNWQEALMASVIALIFALLLCLFFNKKVRGLEIPLCFLLIPYASYELVSFSGLATGFLADKKLTILLACGGVCLFILFNGIKSLSYLAQLLFWSVPLLFIFFIFSPAPNKISFFPEASIFKNSLEHLALLLPAIFALSVTSKYNDGTKGCFLTGTAVGLAAFTAQGIVSSAFGSELLSGRHPVLASALRSPYPIEVFLIGAATFAATVRFALFLVASGMPILKIKNKNIFIAIVFFICTVFLYFTLSS